MSICLPFLNSRSLFYSTVSKQLLSTLLGISILERENLSKQAQRNQSTNPNVYPNTTSLPVPVTGGACVISSTLNHDYSPVISKAWFMHQAWSQDVRFRDVSENACCGYDFIFSGLVMRDHFLWFHTNLFLSHRREPRLRLALMQSFSSFLVQMVQCDLFLLDLFIFYPSFDFPRT